nr:TRIO and F-actin-binding protein isoform X5 [Anas platyrhynchos]
MPSRWREPDLLNFKKGWMSILDEPGEWKKHWFVLTDSSLRYYRDSNAEEADDLDGEIDLRSCTDVTEFAVQRNYGFQIHTKDAIFTLSAMTSGIRRNWIEALRKNVRPVSAPDVTKLSDCNKENALRNCVPARGSLRAEEQQQQRPGSEGSTKSSPWKADGQRHAFDYVELSPLQQDPPSQGSPPRTRGSLRGSERAPKHHEDLERDLALRSEERRRWFESPDSGVPTADGLGGDSSRKAGEPDLPPSPLSEEQRARLNEEIEKKWLELERLPLKDSRRVPLTALLNQGKGNQGGDLNEALRKEVQSLRAQLESCRAKNEATKPQGDSHVPRGYISQEACERSLAEMESSHQQVMEELQRHHQRELERLRQEKERLLAEEAAATAAAIEALKKAHREEMNKELGRTRSFQQCGSSSDALQKQHQLDVDSLKRELQVLSEQYSQKCLEIGQLMEKAEEREQTLQRCQQEGKQLLRKNQELQTRLSDEIGKLRSFISSRCSGDRSQNNERSSCELEVLLRVKENELQYVKKEVQCLREELQMMQKDKRFASGKYQDVYAELNHIKVRSEREIEQLKEHLRLAMAALQEKESLGNSVSE